eukprot:4267268-Pyramimonas_sp.AAC.1
MVRARRPLGLDTDGTRPELRRWQLGGPASELVYEVGWANALLHLRPSLSYSRLCITHIRFVSATGYDVRKESTGRVSSRVIGRLYRGLDGVRFCPDSGFWMSGFCSVRVELYHRRTRPGGSVAISTTRW